MFSDRIESGESTAPAAALVGFRSVSFGDGKAVFEMEADGRHHNPMGTVHGGILCTLADSAMGFAFASTLGPGKSFTTLEVKVNSLRPVFAGKLVAAARVVHRGNLVAHATSTCQVLRGEAARGR
jgi:uncharacterized protein (TIGR00369 family)